MIQMPLFRGIFFTLSFYHPAKALALTILIPKGDQYAK